MAQANSFEHISIMAVKVLARLAAKKAVQAELKDAGVRVTLVAYLLNHPELYVAAHERAQRMIREGVFGKRAQRAYLSSAAQKQNEPISMSSAVHKLGA
jgi:hypothetical protein